MWVVGYLFNNNGMGTWCWEAAHALAERGERVTLVCAADVVLPGHTTVPILRIATPPRPTGVGGKLVELMRTMSASGPRVMRDAVHRLGEEGTPPSVLLLNSTEFFDPDIRVPQMVVAWASGITLRDYASRLRFHLRGFTRASIRILLGTIGWWRRDWRGYRGADVVLAVTARLQRELRSHGVPAVLLHPCTRASSSPPVVDGRQPGMRLLIAAASLEEPRKQVSWMLRALRGAPDTWSLTLIGAAGESVAHELSALAIRPRLLGALSREDTVREMGAHDVLLFASALDDWGYVIAEAMSQGLAVTAPRAAPFDEILGDTGALYSPGDPASFLSAIALIERSVVVARFSAWQRARTMFDGERFVSTLRSAAERMSHE